MRHGVTGQLTADDDPERPQVYSPSRLDPVVRAASVVIGGPAGRRLASRSGFWGAAPVLVLLASAVVGVGVVERQHCRAQGWTSPDQFWHACYSDIPVLYGSANLGVDNHKSVIELLGQGGGLNQPPLSGALMWLTSTFIPSGPDAARQFFDLSAVLLAVLLAVAVAAAVLTLRGRPWDAAHLALSPVVVTAGLISYELLAVTLTALCLLLLARGRPLVGGLLLGLAVASAPQVAVIGLAVAVLASRQVRPGVGTSFAGSALAGWLIVRVLLLPGFSGQLRDAWQGWLDAVPGYGSLWLLPQLLGNAKPNPPDSAGGKGLFAVFGWLFRIGSLNAMQSAFLAAVVFFVLVGLIARYTLLDEPEVGPVAEADGERPPEPEQPDHRAGHDLSQFVLTKVGPLSLALCAAVLLVAKALPVQTSLLLLPLIALSGLRWRDHLIWAGTELVYFVAIWLYIGGETTPTRGLPPAFYLLLSLARLAGIAWVGVQGVFAYRAAHRLMQAQGPVDDPLGGISDERDDEEISPLVGREGTLLGDRDGAAPSHLG